MAAPVSKDRTDENAADGLLVVQVRRLGTIFRKIPKAASPLIRRRDDGRILAHPSARRSLTSGDAEARGMLRRNGGVDSRAEWLGKRGGPPVEVY